MTVSGLPPLTVSGLPPFTVSGLPPLTVSGLPPLTVSGLPPFALVLVASGLPLFFVLVCSTVYVCEVAMLTLLYKGFWRFGGSGGELEGGSGRVERDVGLSCDI